MNLICKISVLSFNGLLKFIFSFEPSRCFLTLIKVPVICDEICYFFGLWTLVHQLDIRPLTDWCKGRGTPRCHTRGPEPMKDEISYDKYLHI